MASELAEEIILSIKEKLPLRRGGEGFSIQTNIEELMLANDWNTLRALRSRLPQSSTPILLYEGSGHDLTPIFILPKCHAIYVDPLYSTGYTKENVKLRISNYPEGASPLTVNSEAQQYVKTQFTQPFENIGYDVGVDTDWPKALQEGSQIITLTCHNQRQSTIILEGHTLTETREELPKLDLIYTNPVSPTTNFLRTFGALNVGGIILYNSKHGKNIPYQYQQLHRVGLVSEPEKFTFSARPFRHLFKDLPWLNQQPQYGTEENIWVMEKLRSNQKEADVIALEQIGLPPDFARPLHLGTAI